jgi:sulfite reductase alpha subunit-like flavoprotein
VDVIPADELLDQTLPDHLPPSAALRTIFTRYLNINAVPRYGFFEILHHFAENSLEKEKLQEFITPEGAVRFRITPSWPG